MDKVEQHILDILKSGTINELGYKLPETMLDRETYKKVNEVLENLGCKWDRKSKLHICKRNILDELNQTVESGITVNKKKLYQFFETPKEVAKRMIDLADIKNGMVVLEPSAGHGAIAEVLAEFYGSLDIALIMVEIDPEKCEVLNSKKIGNVLCEDFMGTFAKEYGQFDRILMNPPFTKQQDIDHINHAFKNCLYPHGKLVAIASNGFTFRANKKSIEFRDLVSKHGYYENLPSGSFKESGTMVNSVIVVLEK